jgi:bla regulator protein BlaR1
MIGALANHLWQSTIFALVAGLLTAAFRHNRAHIRYSLWFAASLKFLVPFSALVSLGSLVAWAPTATRLTPTMAPAVSIIAEQVAQPFSAVSFAATTSPRTPVNWVAPTAMVAWACGLMVVVVFRLRAWRRIRRAMRASTPLDLPNPKMTPAVPVRSAAHLLEPGVVGVWRPVLLLPAGIVSHLTADQLDAVLTHELCHVRRRDNLTAATHMLVEAAAWFHPLVWWIGARLVDERERACDEDVLRSGGEPRVYAEAILNVCRLYVESPLTCVAGVTGSDLKRRLRAIFAGETARDVSRPKTILLTLACGLALIVPLVVGLLDNSVRAQSPSPLSVSTSGGASQFEVGSIKPSQPAISGPTRNQLVRDRSARAQSPSTTSVSTSGAATQFEVVSIKPIDQFGLGAAQLVGDRWTATRITADGLIQLAYDVKPAQIVGLPTWTTDPAQNLFRIEAKLPANASAKDLPLMVQSMLADRFHLIAHRESRTLKVRTITVAKDGLKLRPATGGCTTDPAEDQKVLIDRRRCGEMIESASFPNYHNGVIYRAFSVSMADIAAFFNQDSDTLFVDDTGLKGVYDVEVNLDYTPPSDMDPHMLSDEQSAYRTLVFHKGWQEQAGLVLNTRQERVVPVLVIDHLERPTPNGPAAVLK